MLPDKDVDKLIKQQLSRIRNMFETNINKLERALFDPKKSATERMAILATTLELRQTNLEGNLTIH